MHESFEYTPGAALAPYVERAVGYLHSRAPAGVHVGMPSCSLTLVVPLDEPLTISDPDGPRQAFDSVLAGLGVRPTHIHHDGYQHGIQLALRPSAARALFGCRPAELAHRSVAWANVFGPTAHRLRERLPPSRWRSDDVLAFPEQPDEPDRQPGQPIRGVSRLHDSTVRLQPRTAQEEES